MYTNSEQFVSSKSCTSVLSTQLFPSKEQAIFPALDETKLRDYPIPLLNKISFYFRLDSQIKGV